LRSRKARMPGSRAPRGGSMEYPAGQTFTAAGWSPRPRSGVSRVQAAQAKRRRKAAETRKKRGKRCAPSRAQGRARPTQLPPWPHPRQGVSRSARGTPNPLIFSAKYPAVRTLQRTLFRGPIPSPTEGSCQENPVTAARRRTRRPRALTPRTSNENCTAFDGTRPGRRLLPPAVPSEGPPAPSPEPPVPFPRRPTQPGT
jgi:hypothetical protein